MREPKIRRANVFEIRKRCESIISARRENAITPGDYSYLENGADFQTQRILENPWGLKIRVITRMTRPARIPSAILREIYASVKTFFRD